MTIILASSNTAPLDSAINCCTIITTINILLRDKLVTFVARTDWPDVCISSGTGTLCFFVTGGLANGIWISRGRCCCYVLPRSAAAKETPGVVRFEEKPPHVVALGVLCDFRSCSCSSACLQQLSLAGWAFSASANWQLQLGGVEAAFPFSEQSLCRCPPPHHKRGEGLFAITPHVAELLAVVALGKSILGSISLHPDSNVAEAWQKKSATFLVVTLVPFLVLWNSKFSLTTRFSCFCNWIRLRADVRTIGGGRPVLAGAVYHVVRPRYWRNPYPCHMFGAGRRNYGWRPPWAMCLLRQTLRHSLLSLNLGLSHLCCAACASRLLRSHPLGWEQTSTS
jgi:hypothetical protein